MIVFIVRLFYVFFVHLFSLTFLTRHFFEMACEMAPVIWIRNVCRCVRTPYPCTRTYRMGSVQTVQIDKTVYICKYSCSNNDASHIHIMYVLRFDELLFYYYYYRHLPVAAEAATTLAVIHVRSRTSRHSKCVRHKRKPTENDKFRRMH